MITYDFEYWFYRSTWSNLVMSKVRIVFEKINLKLLPFRCQSAKFSDFQPRFFFCTNIFVQKLWLFSFPNIFIFSDIFFIDVSKIVHSFWQWYTKLLHLGTLLLFCFSVLIFSWLFTFIIGVLFPLTCFCFLEANLSKTSWQTPKNVSNFWSFLLSVLLNNLFIRTYLNLLLEISLYFL